MEISSLLCSMNLRGTFFIDPGKANSLTDTQLRSLAGKNELGSHTWSHKNLKLSRMDEIRNELTTSKSYIEQITGQPVIGLAYPWGKYSALAERVAEECQYLFANR